MVFLRSLLVLHQKVALALNLKRMVAVITTSIRAPPHLAKVMATLHIKVQALASTIALALTSTAAHLLQSTEKAEDQVQVPSPRKAHPLLQSIVMGTVPLHPHQNTRMEAVAAPPSMDHPVPLSIKTAAQAPPPIERKRKVAPAQAALGTKMGALAPPANTRMDLRPPPGIKRVALNTGMVTAAVVKIKVLWTNIVTRVKNLAAAVVKININLHPLPPDKMGISTNLPPQKAEKMKISIPLPHPRKRMRT